MSHPIHEANENSPYGNLTKDQFYHKHQISHQETFMINQHNMKIYTQSWQPAGSSPARRLKGLVAMIHGYTSESGWLFELNAVAIAKSGFFVCAIDLQGHGHSEGPPEHITDIRPLVDDCIQYFGSAIADHPSLPHFLYGESLGAAIAILVALQQRNIVGWKGLVLAGTMCEVSRKFKPVWPLEKLLPGVAFLAPTWRIAVTEPAVRKSYKETWKRKLAEKSPNRRSCGRATAASGLEFLRVCEYIKRNCGELEVAMLVVHGGDDVICEPKGAKYLYECVGSKDKSLKVYEGMWHQWIGEDNERVEEVFETILSWIEVRACLINTNS